MSRRAVLEVLSPGAMASIQDRGRLGWWRIGVPLSGALEPGWLRLANALLGNPEDVPAIEFLAGGLALLRLFGSASTYARGGLGGVDGRLLAPGVRLSVAAVCGAERMLSRPPVVDEAAIRVVAGPQDDHFDARRRDRRSASPLCRWRRPSGRRARQAELQALLAGVGPLAEPGEHDPQVVYTANLISGVVDATSADADGSPVSADRSPGER